MARVAVPVTQADVERAVRGAMKAGFAVGRIVVDLERRRVTILPVAPEAPDDDLGDELAEWRREHGYG